MLAMPLPEGVLTLQGRIDTFGAAHHLPKRRASSVKKRGPTTVSWPHSSPLPEDLARAGFFYKPSAESNDNCMCFICHRQLDGWEDGDDPIEEHVKHAPDCGWAINAVINKRTTAGVFVNEDPMSEKLVESRTATYVDAWPYEQKKGWKCKVAKMVAAGWCYDPSPEYDDGVTCMYCNLSLDGWEPKDDPFKEHEKRAPECEFFKLIEEWASTRKTTKKKGGRASRGSKASRLSTQSNVTAVSEAPTLMSLDDLPAAEDDSILTTATNATTTSTTTKGRKKAAPKGKGKTTRGKKTSTLDSSMMETDPPEPVVEEPVVEEPPKKRATRKASRTVSSQLEDTIVSSQTQKPTRAKAAKGKPKHRMSEDESQLHMELQAAVESSLIEREETPKPKRGTKRTSDGMAKMDSSVVMLSDAPADIQAQQDKPKRGRKAKQQTAAEPESDVIEIPQRVSSMPEKPASKPKKDKKAAAPAEPDLEPEPELEAEQTEEPEVAYPTLDTENVEMHDFAQSLVAPVNPYAQDMEGEVSPNFAESIAAAINPYEPEQHTPQRSEDVSPAPPTPTPARHSSAAQTRRTMTPVKAFEIAKDPTPTPSPQSSDAENHPPSSRPSAVRPLPQLPQSARRVPLADTTPEHVNMSPSKRNVLNNITSTQPWSPTDLETVFLNSPVKANLALNSVILSDWDKENQAALDAVDLERLDKKALGDVVKRVRAGMSADEKKMSVEEWVRWNATRGEDRLKGECEGMVMKFEKEGGRALRVLEGIECVE